MDKRLTQLRSAILVALDGVSSEEPILHADGKWNAAEILEHLNLTYIGTTKGLTRCLQSGQPASSGNRLKNFPRRWGVIALGYFPPGRKSPERALPRGMPFEQVKAEIIENLAALDEVITQCENRFGSQAITDHPALGPLTAAEWRKFHLVHGMHHVKQINRLKQS